MNTSPYSLARPIREAGGILARRVACGDTTPNRRFRLAPLGPLSSWSASADHDGGGGDSLVRAAVPRDVDARNKSGHDGGGTAAGETPARANRAAASVAGFWRGRRGSLAVETALSVSLLVIALAGVMEIVHSVYVEDRMGRASRAAARAIALVPEAGESALANRACAAIRRELDLGDRFDCATRLAVKVDRNLAPAGLLRDADTAPAGGAGEMVVVRIAWSGGAWNPGELVADDDEDARPVAVGIARLEPVAGS